VSKDPKLKVFLSYARGDDEAFAQRLHIELTKAGFDVWFDRVSMPSRQLTFLQEIRDTIAACDRVLLVVGPRAVASDYVTQEWRFGLEIGKGINPVVRLNPEKGDGYDLIPEELKLLHTEDFRDDSSFTKHFKNLVRQLSSPVAPPGQLIGVPTLPTHYQAQPERLKALKQQVLADIQRPLIVTGAAARVGVQGMGGIGKSVLAAALGRDLETRRAFPDGIMWIGVGQHPNIVELQRNAVRALGGDAVFDDPQVGKQALRLALENQALLLILDDVWKLRDVEAFDAIGARCKLLLTTRDAALIRGVAGTGFEVELPSEKDALALLALAARVPVDSLPPITRDVVAECGRLPLAIALCGGMAAGGTPWTDMLDALREHELEFVSTEQPGEGQHPNVWRAMEVSVRVLPEEQQRRFAELAVFAKDATVTEAAVLTMWSQTGELSERHGRRLLVSLKDRALVQLDRPVDGSDHISTRVSLHDLLHDLATRLALNFYSVSSALHAELIAGYRKRCPQGWPSCPPDGYFFQHLRTHLVKAGEADELLRLLLKLEWLELKSSMPATGDGTQTARYGDIYDLLEDFSTALDANPIVNEWEFVSYLFRIVRAHFTTWVDASHRLYPQLYPFIRSAPASVAAAAQGWLDQYFERPSRSGPWFRQLTPTAINPAEDYLTIPTEGESPEVLLFSSNGHTLIGAVSRSIRAWSLTSGRTLFSHQFETDAILIQERPEKKDFVVVLRSGRLYRVTERGELEELFWLKIPLDCADIALGTNLLAVGDEFGQLGIWDIEEGRRIIQKRGSRTPISAVCFNEQGDYLLVARETGFFNCFHSSTLEPVLTKPVSGHILRAVPSSPRAGWYLGGLNGSVSRWECGLETAIPLGHAGRSPVNALTRAGDVLLSGDLQGQIRCWKPSTDDFQGSISFGVEPVRALALLGDRLAVSRADEPLRLMSLTSSLNVDKGSNLKICTSPSWSGDYTHVIGGTETGEIAVASVEEQTRVLMSEVALFNGAAASHSSSDLWVAGAGPGIIVVNPTKRVVVDSGRASGRVTSIAIHGAGELVATGYYTGLGVIWDSQSASDIGRFQMHAGSVNAVSYANDASLLASAGADGTVALWKLALLPASADSFRGISYAKGRVLPRLESTELHRTAVDKSNRPVTALALSQDNKVLALAVLSRLLLWSFPELELIAELPQAESMLLQIAISPDGAYLAGVTAEARCLIWRLEDRSIVCDFQALTPALGCAWRPDGKAIALTAGGGLTIFHLEGLPTGDPIVISSRENEGNSFRLFCPHQRLRAPWHVPASQLGATTKCPECKRSVRIAATFFQPLLIS
jgi:WD40 repeat protein